MSRPFQSFDFLNRGWDVRLLESQSLRYLFVMLSVSLFMLGMLTSMLIYQFFRLRRLDWTAVILLSIFIIPVARYSRVIYRRLGR